MSEPWYIAVDMLTGEQLHDDLPLSIREAGPGLSSAGSLRAVIAPDEKAIIRGTTKPILVEQRTAIFHVDERTIYGGWILISSYFNGKEWEVEGTSYSGYPTGQPYQGEFFPTAGVALEVIIAEIWRHLQAYPDGNIGVQIRGQSGVIVGTIEEPYSLSWVDSKDCGSEIRSLVSSAGVEFVESHEWREDGGIDHIITIAPRFGRRREDLKFVQDENIFSPITQLFDGDDYANDIQVIGAGEGAESPREQYAVRDGRIRRAKTVPAKNETDSTRLRAIGYNTYRSFALVPTLKSIDVIDHENAKFGSWQLGDEIYVQANIPWVGDVLDWYRIVGWAVQRDGKARIELQRLF